MNTNRTRILVVDDSALYRQSIQNVLREIADTEVVGIAKNGVEAISKIEQLSPDLLTLDVQMPDMNGIQVLQEIKRRRLRPKAIMVSSLTSEGAQVTTDALLEGAFDFILKPASNDSFANREELQNSLSEKIYAFREALAYRRSSAKPVSQRALPANKVAESAPIPDVACQAVILGTSTGGPEALKFVLPKLTGDLGVPLLVVQHMPPQYTQSLAKRLNEICELEVLEAFDGLEAASGRIIIAAGGKQLKLERRDTGLFVSVNQDPLENGVRPSVDYLLRSAMDVFQGKLLAVIMTGMGRDGLVACRHLKQLGGYVFAQSQEDCVVYGMPKAVIDEGLADRTLPLGKIAPAILRHLKRSRS